MERVWCLWHSHERDGVDEVKLIGAFTTRAKARAARAQVCRQPGFRDHARGFSVSAVPLDQVAWTEGFVTIRDGG